ncbi:immunity-related GTPase family M protein 1-like [Canis lupus baileyi]|uniref:Immunity-related GTPase M4 n=2 Tax=Canis lupus familiaris TaxID=9615 RepID=C3UZV0_CANLF|nr:immunity-related GTPase family M protein-like [Canis lupus familiaris]XP_025302518.1 immunity-related GTPase family M protein-like [Canis lupus dingo]XP_025302519.1 immunity-related GTPase family M protein-like [Canis lupus dingo]XP_038536908.1 immunity-related GTPase family M protein-like isoform X1 [Canis lupus familiaris]XP_038536909.1 immunity-related GTPase family M protein-like isoform X1 [Canis lupus familiaris]XP_038536910.1 immunity-related GTPase family M protein-like isoform X1 [|eukprot:NP_001300775.1 immunity-related GTPase family M protein-like [Canis lupus familiaris]
MAQPTQSLHTPSPTSFTSTVPYHKGGSILSESGAMNIEKALGEGKLLDMVSVVRETLETASSVPVSIAVTGDSGNGMSTFINALRKIGHNEEDSAPTGVVRTTQIPTCYSFSDIPNVELWDLPGTGAATQNLETYLEEMQFSKYDLFIIIASEQFSMNLVKLVKSIQGQGKRFYIVWTKLDRDLSTCVLSEEQLLRNIRENIRETLHKEGVCEPIIFLVSSFNPFLHDFPELRKSLHRDISNIGYRGHLENLTHTCEKVINGKVTTLQGQIGSKSFQDILGIQNANDLGEFLNAYHRLFGVDDDSLQEVAQSMGKPKEEYKAIMKSQDLHTALAWDWALSWMNCNAASYLYSVLSYIPILGTTGIHYLKWWSQGHLLEIVAEDTKTILKKILEDAII